MELQNRSLKKKINLRFFILSGLLGVLIIFYGFFLRYRSLILSFNQEPPSVYDIKVQRVSLPNVIKIDAAGIDLSIEPAKISGGVWEVSDKSANFLETSARPGEGGNIVIYGHNKKAIFGNLIIRNLIGESIEIVNDEGKSFFYEIKESLTVNPSDMIVVSPTNYEVLTVYTCTGIFDSKRLVLKALPLKKD